MGSYYSKICGRKLRPWIEGKKEAKFIDRYKNITKEES